MINDTAMIARVLPGVIFGSRVSRCWRLGSGPLRLDLWCGLLGCPATPGKIARMVRFPAYYRSLGLFGRCTGINWTQWDKYHDEAAHWVPADSFMNSSS
jgi:hypothetical protein